MVPTVLDSPTDHLGDELDEDGNEIFEIALFPIPGSVSFPLSTVPLHIFEPRYRMLMKDAVRLNRRVGICHTRKVIHAAKTNQSTEEALRSNQATYDPFKVFSAGVPEILDILPDGRLMVQIAMDSRYEFIEDVQMLPYRIARCRRYEDQPGPRSIEQAEHLRERINARLVQMSSERGGELAMLLESQNWQKLSAEEFSFLIFQIIRFDADEMQEALEMRAPDLRLEILARALEA